MQDFFSSLDLQLRRQQIFKLAETVEALSTEAPAALALVEITATMSRQAPTLPLVQTVSSAVRRCDDLSIDLTCFSSATRFLKKMVSA